MTLKSLFVVGVLVLAPLSSFAMCSKDSHEANACETGQVWDHESGACVDMVTG